MKWAEVSKSKNFETVREAVNKLDVNEHDAQGRTPLMLFITNWIELLLAQNIDLEVRR